MKLSKLISKCETLSDALYITGEGQYIAVCMTNVHGGSAYYKRHRYQCWVQLMKDEDTLDACILNASAPDSYKDALTSLLKKLKKLNKKAK